MKIVYMVTDQCNANCPHCYNRRSENKKGEKSLKEYELDLISFRTIGYEVIIAGSEILCDPKIISLYKLIGQKHLLSNGIIPAKNPSILSEFGENGICEIHLSWHFDFPYLSQQFPEAITLQAIKNAKKYDLEIHLNCVVGNQNFDSIAGLCEKAVELGVREVKFLKLLPISKKMMRFRLTDNQTRKVIQNVKSVREKYSEETLRVRLHANFDSELTEKSINARRLGLFCPAGKEFLVIATDSSIYPCPFLQAEEFKLGFLSRGNLVIEREINHDGRICLASKIYHLNMKGE